MKLKAKQEIKDKPAAELEKECGKSREDLQRLKFDLAAGKLKNVRNIRHTKKKIAVIMTAINSKKRTV